MSLYLYLVLILSFSYTFYLSIWSINTSFSLSLVSAIFQFYCQTFYLIFISVKQTAFPSLSNSLSLSKTSIKTKKDFLHSVSQGDISLAEIFPSKWFPDVVSDTVEVVKRFCLSSSSVLGLDIIKSVSYVRLKTH